MCGSTSATVAVGRGYRTNAEGIRQFARDPGRRGHGSRGAAAPLARTRRRDAPDVADQPASTADLAVVYSPLLPVPFRECLLARGFALIETPDQEFESMGTNVLALAPGRCLMLRAIR